MLVFEWFVFLVYGVKNFMVFWQVLQVVVFGIGGSVFQLKFFIVSILGCGMQGIFGIGIFELFGGCFIDYYYVYLGIFGNLWDDFGVDMFLVFFNFVCYDVC